MNNTRRFKTIARKLGTCALSIAFFAEGMMFYNHYSYAHHVEEAKSSITELEEILEGKGSENLLGASLLDAFEVDDNLGDIKLRNLTRKIVSSTEHAIKNADDIKQTKKLKKAVDQISVVQNESVTMIESAMEKVESKDLGKEVEKTYDKALDLQEKVVQASEEIQVAIDNNQQTIDIEILADKSHGHHESEEDSEEHDEQVAEPAAVTRPNPNLERILKQREEDAKQREANRKRIKLIESGRQAKEAQRVKNKLSKAQSLSSNS